MSEPVSTIHRKFTFDTEFDGSPLPTSNVYKRLYTAEEAERLAAAARAEEAKGSVLQFVGVDAADPPATALPFITQSVITCPVAQDSTLRVTAGLYGLDAEPNTFFIDESGTVVAHVIGPVSPAQLDSWIHKLVGGT